MPKPQQITRAELREIEWDGNRQASEINPDNTVKVQFNPQSLKINFSSQSAGGDQRGGASSQFLGTGTTKLSLELWFDVTVPLPEGTPDPNGDVRRLTKRVAHFITPQQKTNAQGEEQWVPPGVRLVWGTFLFDGIMESMDETVEYFSEEGKPLRASVSINIARQDVYFEFNQTGNGDGPGSTNTAGTRPRTQAQAGDSVQQMAARAGRPKDWKKIATANGIENPRQIEAGSFININIS
jgi:hypothetical protein